MDLNRHGISAISMGRLSTPDPPVAGSLKALDRSAHPEGNDLRHRPAINVDPSCLSSAVLQPIAAATGDGHRNGSINISALPADHQ